MITSFSGIISDSAPDASECWSSMTAFCAVSMASSGSEAAGMPLVEGLGADVFGAAGLDFDGFLGGLLFAFFAPLLVPFLSPGHGKSARRSVCVRARVPQNSHSSSNHLFLMIHFNLGKMLNNSAMTPNPYLPFSIRT